MDQGIPVKRTIVAGVLLLAGVAGAAAADMPVPQGAPVPPLIYRPAFYDWSGVYVGVNAGYGFGQASWIDINGSTGNFNTNAFVIGGTLGANYQTGPYIVGFEGDIDWTNLSGTSSSAGCINISADSSLPARRARPNKTGSAPRAPGSAMPSIAFSFSAPPAPPSAMSARS